MLGQVVSLFHTLSLYSL